MAGHSPPRTSRLGVRRTDGAPAVAPTACMRRPLLTEEDISHLSTGGRWLPGLRCGHVLVPCCLRSIDPLERRMGWINGYERCSCPVSRRGRLDYPRVSSDLSPDDASNMAVPGGDDRRRCRRTNAGRKPTPSCAAVRPCNSAHRARPSAVRAMTRSGRMQTSLTAAGRRNIEWRRAFAAWEARRTPKGCSSAGQSAGLQNRMPQVRLLSPLLDDRPAARPRWGMRDAPAWPVHDAVATPPSSF